jgi:NACHT domain
LLPYAAQAPFNAPGKDDAPLCLPNTRVEILQQIRKWANADDNNHIFWLNGLAGTGKSTIARTVAREQYDRKHLAASFFFSRVGGDVSHAGKFFTSIAVQLANNAPPLRRYICEKIMELSDIATQSLRDQWRQLVLDPLSKLDGNSGLLSYTLVVDALDECEDKNDIWTVLQLLAEARSLKTVRLRIFLTSRPEIPVRLGFSLITQAEHQDFALQALSLANMDHDITIFLEYNLRLIRQERALDADWSSEQVIRQLVRNASGLFIWAATACRFIRDGKQHAPRRLNMILEGSSTSATAPVKHLNELYIAVLKQSISPSFTHEEKEESYGMLRYILGCIVVFFSPLSAYSLSRLIRVTEQKMHQTLDGLHAILDIPEDQNVPLRLHHPAFRDFLLEKDKCGDLNFWVDERQAHRTLADSCIRLMSTGLQEDICGLGAPDVLVTDIGSGRVNQYLPSEAQYTCLYWVEHLQNSGLQLHDNDQVHQFLQMHLLHWLEALSWMQKLSEGILAITSLETMALVSLFTPCQAFFN